MNVKCAIINIENRMARANNAISRCREKEKKNGIERENLDGSDKELIFQELFNDKISNIEDYLEELQEVMNVLKGMDPEEKVVFTTEEEMEEDCGVYWNSDVQKEELSNNSAIIIECINYDEGTTILVICMLKTLNET